MKTRIVLADDHKMFRDGLRLLISEQKNMEIVGEAGNGREAVQISRKVSPDVVIVDVAMPELNGIEATRQLIELPCKPKVIGLSAYADRRYVSQMLKAGASGYVLKDNTFEDLIQAINTVVKGHPYLSSPVTGALITEFKQTTKESNGTVFSILSARELEVLQKIAEGFSTKEMAYALGISAKTIETHRRQLMEKLNLHTVADLTKYAVKEGLTDLDH
jgi:DNA-binding NarL/FixJ family response regulator